MTHSFPFALSCREKDFTAEFDYFLRGKESMRMDVRVPEVKGLTKEQVSGVGYVTIDR